MKKILIIILVIIAIICLFIFIPPKKLQNTYFNKVELDSSVYITNLTGDTYLDTVVKTGLGILEIDSTFVFISPLKITSFDDYDVNAYIILHDQIYYIYIRKMGKEKTILTLSHELIHLKQFHEGRLISSPKYIKFDDSDYSPTYPYSLRPWEIEAFNEESRLSEKIKVILY